MNRGQGSQDPGVGKIQREGYLLERLNLLEEMYGSHDERISRAQKKFDRTREGTEKDNFFEAHPLRGHGYLPVKELKRDCELAATADHTGEGLLSVEIGLGVIVDDAVLSI